METFSVDAVEPVSACQDVPGAKSDVYDAPVQVQPTQFVVSSFPSKSLEYTNVSTPPTTSFTARSRSTDPLTGLRPVFIRVTLTNLVPSPSCAFPVAGSVEAGAIVNPSIATSWLSRVRTDRKSPAPGHPRLSIHMAPLPNR